jgi:ketol-acid reductoisomerase
MGPLSSETYETMQEIVDEIRAGKFAHKWMLDRVNQLRDTKRCTFYYKTTIF